MIWEVLTTTGTAASLHDRPTPADQRRRVWIHTVGGPALVLGSTQSEGLIQPLEAHRAGLERCRRRSGGGAVLVRPGDTWIDVLIGREDPLWSDDVSLAFAWLGRTWQRALASAGLDSTSRHTGRLTNPRGAICFAGMGPGEVVAGDRTKVVGMAQRRTRSVARFQTMVPRRQPLGDTLRFLEPSVVAGIDPDALIGATLEPEVLVPAFLAELPTDGGELDRPV